VSSVTLVTQGSKNGTEMVFFFKWALAKMSEIGILRVSYVILPV
jgi:hypothetical protein